MQTLLYFTPVAFMPHPLCFPLVFDSSPNHLLVSQEPVSNFTENENTRMNSSVLGRAEGLDRETEEQKQSLDCKPVTKTKKIGRNFDVQQSDDEYKVRSESIGVIYKKKNTESNIINQVFSFVCTAKSRNSVLNFFNRDESKANGFYSVMEKVKKGNKKYINRKFIRKLIVPEGDLLLERAVAKAKDSRVLVGEVRRLLRALVFRFLREEVNATLLTSCKIYKSTLAEHFWRKREILGFLFGPQRRRE